MQKLNGGALEHRAKKWNRFFAMSDAKAECCIARKSGNRFFAMSDAKAECCIAQKRWEPVFRHERCESGNVASREKVGTGLGCYALTALVAWSSRPGRSEEHTSQLQSLHRITYARL